MTENLALRPEGPAADSRDMVAVHDMFRRQFRRLPELLAAVPVEDPARVRVVTDHAAFLTTILHAHHGGEDAVVWPRITARASAEDLALTATMLAQHERIDRALEDAATATAALAAEPSEQAREAAVAAVRAALPPIEEHLALEEAEVLRLIDRFLTQDEWAATAGHGMDSLPPEMFPVMFGMLLEDMGPQMYAIFSGPIPDEVIVPMTEAGPLAYGEYRARLEAAVG
jgi:hemerythrin-like domain-containing protein